MAYKVGVVGYGTIGKRVADAVMQQDDMKLVGVTARTLNWRIRIAHDKKIPLYFCGNGERQDYEEEGIPLAGEMEDLIKECDIIADCTPKKCGAANRDQFYKPLKTKAIFQGGEKSDVGECSFNAQSNYDDALNKDLVRVVSCNTTGIARSLNALNRAIGVKKAKISLIRRATDPAGVGKGPINAIVPVVGIPSHHGPDVMTVIKGVDVFSAALIVPTTLMHFHIMDVKLKNRAGADEIKQIFKSTTRLRMVRAKDQIESTAHILEYARDLGNPRGDMMDLCVWEESINPVEDELWFTQAVHQESDVVPDTVDCIRAMMGYEDAIASITKTNRSLGLQNGESFTY